MLVNDVSFLLPSLIHASTCCMFFLGFALVSVRNGEAFRTEKSPRVLSWRRDVVDRFIDDLEAFRINDTLSWLPCCWFNTPVFLDFSATSLGVVTISLCLSIGAVYNLLVYICGILLDNCDEICERFLLVLIDDVSLLRSLFKHSTGCFNSVDVLADANWFFPGKEGGRLHGLG